MTGPNFFEFIRNQPTDFIDRLGLSRDCDQENIDFNRNCKKTPAPWPYETCDNTPAQNKAARARYCEAKCQKAYMTCLEDNGNEFNSVIVLDDVLMDILEGVVAVGVAVK